VKSQGSKYECPKCLVSEQKNDQPNATELQHGTQKSPYSDLKKNGNQVTGIFKANIIPNLLSDKFPTIQPEIIFNSFKPHFLEFHGTFQLQVCACPAASNATQAAQHQAGAAAIACPAAARPVLPGPRW
jgi:hypothetical protein